MPTLSTLYDKFIRRATLTTEEKTDIRSDIGAGAPATTESVLALIAGDLAESGMIGREYISNEIRGKLTRTNTQLHTVNLAEVIGVIPIPASRAVEGQKIRFKGSLFFEQYNGEDDLEHPCIVLGTPATIGPDVLGASGAFGMLCITRPANSVVHYNFEVSLTAANGGSSPAPGSLGITKVDSSAGYLQAVDFAGVPFIGQANLEDFATGGNAVAPGVIGSINVWFAVDSLLKPDYTGTEVWGDLIVQYDLEWFFVD